MLLLHLHSRDSNLCNTHTYVHLQMFIIPVGAPMEVKKNLEPTPEEIDAVHADFTKRLVALFESEKKKYLKYHEDAKLIIT